MRKLLVWITGTKFWSFLLLKVIPYCRFSTYYTDFTGKQFYSGYMQLKVGDIILTKDKRKLTTLLVGGQFTHAALCIGGTIVDYQVAEMTHVGYKKTWFFDVCKESDRVVIIRCKDFDDEYVRHVVEKCKSFEGCAYDLEFDLGVKALYCSELVFQADFERRLQVDMSDAKGLGRQYVSPTDLYEAENTKVIFDSDDFK